MISIPRVESFANVNTKWNSNLEVAQILCAAAHHPEWISAQVRERPHSGTQLLFRRFSEYNFFKADGFLWKCRKEGKLIREDHVKLKVQKREIIAANYAHSAVVSTFHRRIYWLTNNPDLVLVHYLNTPEEDTRNAEQSVEARIAQTIRASGLKLSQNELHAQLEPIFSALLGATELADLSHKVSSLLSTQLTVELPDHSHGHLERRNSCSSAVRKGLSSVALRRQPSTFSDSIDPHFIGNIVSNCGKVEGDRQREWPPPPSETPQESVDDGELSHLNSQPCTSSCAPSTSGDSWLLQPIVNVTPKSASLKGGTEILVVGPWYLKGHEYSVQFGERRVPACLIQVGVLAVRTPPVVSSGIIPLRVLCDGSVMSASFDFAFRDEFGRDDVHSFLLQNLVDRMHLLLAAFDVPAGTFQGFASSALDEDAFLAVARFCLQYKMINAHLVQPIGYMPSRTVLHLAAALNYHRLTEYLLWWRTQLSYTRELDPLARDAEGCTPLHLAVRLRHLAAAKVLVRACRATVDVLDDRGRTPSDLATDETFSRLTARADEPPRGAPQSSEDAEHLANTALWVYTNGESLTNTLHSSRSAHSSDSLDGRRPNETDDDRRATNHKRKPAYWKDCEAIHVEISMNTTDVHVPDSPKMADLFDAVTSPGVFINDGVRERMAQLAQHIIDALPERIKADAQTHDYSLYADDQMFSAQLSNLDEYMNFNINIGSISHSFSSKTHPSEDGVSQPHSPTLFRRSHLVPSARESFNSSAATTFESGSFDLDNSKDLGEFLNAESAGGDVGPLQQQLGNLRLSENEQRDVYEAAKTIQRAYREYRARTSNAPHAEAERKAAITIQSFYRRYKSFQYFKRLYNAAIVVQKHFRMKKKGRGGQQRHEEEGEEDENGAMNDDDARLLPEKPSVDGMSIRIQVPPNSSTLLREHRAAATIQHAYRGHRKRQAAARKIQNFMRQSRIKLRKMHEQNAGECTMQPDIATEDGASCQLQDSSSLHQPVRCQSLLPRYSTLSLHHPGRVERYSLPMSRLPAQEMRNLQQQLVFQPDHRSTNPQGEQRVSYSRQAAVPQPPASSQQQQQQAMVPPTLPPISAIHQNSNNMQ